MNYANQHRIYTTQFETIEHQPGDSEQFLKAMSWDKILNVEADLTGNELKFWLYLMRWYGQGFYDYSPVNLEVELGISKNTALAAKTSLLNKGYLVQITTNTFNFIPYPEGVEVRAFQTRDENRKKIDERNHARK